MALAQNEQQQTQEPTKDTQTTAPAKGKKKNSTQEPTKAQTKPATRTETRGQTNSRTQGATRNQPGTTSSTSQTNVNQSTQSTQTNRVNVQEFKSRHSEVFNLGRHPRDYFVQRYGAKHVRMIGNSYFVFTDGCWVAVDADGFTYTERVICQGDPDFVSID